VASTNEPLDDVERPGHVAKLVARERAEIVGEQGDAGVAPLVEGATSLERRTQEDSPAILWIGVAIDEARAFQFGDDACHRRGADLFGGRERAEADGATGDDDGERRQLRRRQSRGGILAAEAPEEVDGCRVQPVGRLERGAGRATSWAHPCRRA
jgi:hypothetical protein